MNYYFFQKKTFHFLPYLRLLLKTISGDLRFLIEVFGLEDVNSTDRNFLLLILDCFPIDLSCILIPDDAFVLLAV